MRVRRCLVSISVPAQLFRPDSRPGFCDQFLVPTARRQFTVTRFPHHVYHSAGRAHVGVSATLATDSRMTAYSEAILRLACERF
jgi:hypothetical protein